jgi:translation initiation factor IF-3
MRPRTDDHDVEVKTRKIQEFLAEGDKVRVSVQFRGAEMRHPDIGRKLLDGIADVLKGSAVIEQTPKMEGRMMSMTVSRAPGWEPPKKLVAEKARSASPNNGKTAEAVPADAPTTSPTPAPVSEQNEAVSMQSES